MFLIPNLAIEGMPGHRFMRIAPDYRLDARKIFLRDHEKDPYEWENLARHSKYDRRLKKMRRLLQEMVVPHQLAGFSKLKIQ